MLPSQLVRANRISITITIIISTIRITIHWVVETCAIKMSSEKCIHFGSECSITKTNNGSNIMEWTMEYRFFLLYNKEVYELQVAIETRISTHCSLFDLLTIFVLLLFLLSRMRKNIQYDSTNLSTIHRIIWLVWTMLRMPMTKSGLLPLR